MCLLFFIIFYSLTIDKHDDWWCLFQVLRCMFTKTFFYSLHRSKYIHLKTTNGKSCLRCNRFVFSWMFLPYFMMNDNVYSWRVSLLPLLLVKCYSPCSFNFISKLVREKQNPSIQLIRNQNTHTQTKSLITCNIPALSINREQIISNN